MRQSASRGVLVQYVDTKRAEHNVAYEFVWQPDYGLMRVIFDPCIPRPPISPD